MRPAIYAVLGSIVTTLASMSAGVLLLRLLRLQLKLEEQRLLAFFAGSAMLSILVFAFAALHLVFKGVIFGLTLLLLVAARKAWSFHEGRQKEVPREQWILIGLVLAGYGTWYAVNAWAPEHSPDGVMYHLGLVTRYYRAHGFERIVTNMYAHLSQGLEMLFLFAYAVGRHSAASLVHCTFLFALPLALITFGRHINNASAGLFAATLVFASPVFGIDGTSAYNDVALAAVLFALFWTLELWRESKQPGFIVLAGLLAGFAFSIKYTGGIGIILALAYMWRSWRAIGVLLASAAVIAAPWLIKNAAFTGNPLAPLANDVFPNPVYYVDLEQQYRAHLKNYDGVSRFGLAWDVTVDGGRTGGLLGPVFLLSPLAFIALRRGLTARLLGAVLLFAIPFGFNMGTRFLMPSAVLAALALGIALRRRPKLMLGVAALHAILSWPSVIPLYANEAAWRISELPWRAALRLENEDDYLSQRSFAYVQSRLLEQYVPPDHRVFGFGSMAADAYTSRELVVGFQSSLGETIRETLHTPLITDTQPTRWLLFEFPELQTKTIRVCQTETSIDSWSISELRLLRHGKEIPREPSWRLRAQPNPWQVQRAFDNSPVTRWNAHQPSRPGMCVEVSLPRATLVDAVRLESSRDQYKVRLKLEAADEPGRWREVNARMQDLESPPLPQRNLRRAAIQEVKQLGIQWLLVDDGDFAAKDFSDYSADWGIRLIAQRASARLYFLE